MRAGSSPLPPICHPSVEVEKSSSEDVLMSARAEGGAASIMMAISAVQGGETVEKRMQCQYAGHSKTANLKRPSPAAR